ncbi:hypothetical protein CLAIMM_08339 isoform 2, partial [Cladophialophora immunda]
ARGRAPGSPSSETVKDCATACMAAAGRMQGQTSTPSTSPLPVIVRSPSPLTSIDRAITQLVSQSNTFFRTHHPYSLRTGVNGRGYGSHLTPVVGHVTTAQISLATSSMSHDQAAKLGIDH